MRSEQPLPDAPDAPPIMGGGSDHSALRTPHSALAPLIVLSGPSGSGKSTVVDRLLALSPLPLRRAVTATTRAPRPGEEPEKSYHFWTPDQFRKAIDDGRMLEWAVVFGRDYYGTPRDEVDAYRERGMGVILVIDVQGAEQVRRKYPGDHLSVFVNAPSMDVLRQRLVERGTEDPGRVERRLATARAETARAGEFDHQLVNNCLDDAVRALEQLIRDRFVRRG